VILGLLFLLISLGLMMAAVRNDKLRRAEARRNERTWKEPWLDTGPPERSLIRRIGGFGLEAIAATLAPLFFLAGLTMIFF
jgi:hypothetical protein